MRFLLSPHVGADPLLFGMNRADVRTILSGSALSTKSTEPENDFYLGEGLILGYDEKDELEYIEFIPPASVSYSDVDFFEEEFSEVLKKMAKHVPGVGFEDGGYNFEPLGIAIYSPLKKIESVSLYRAASSRVPRVPEFQSSGDSILNYGGTRSSKRIAVAGYLFLV